MNTEPDDDIERDDPLGGGVMPALSFIRSPLLYPEALVGLNAVGFRRPAPPT